MITTIDDPRLLPAPSTGVVRGWAGWLARPVARHIGLRLDGATTARVWTEAVPGARRTVREFGSRRWATTMSLQGGRLVERVGPLRLEFAIHEATDGVQLTLRTVRLSRLSLRRPLGLRIEVRTQRACEGLVVTVQSRLAGFPFVGYEASMR